MAVSASTAFENENYSASASHQRLEPVYYRNLIVNSLTRLSVLKFYYGNTVVKAY